MPDETTTAETTTQTTEAATTAASVASGTETSATTTEQKPAEGAASTTTVPEKYELKLPDGSMADAGLVERTTAIAREWGLSNEVAQKLLDREVARTAEISTATKTAVDAAKAEQLTAMQPGGAVWKEQETKWHDQSLADAEIGGSPEKLQASVDLALKVVNKFATPDTTKFFTDTGLGSHPELVRVFARIGKVMSEATLVAPGATGSSEQKTLAEKLYPSMAKAS